MQNCPFHLHYSGRALQIATFAYSAIVPYKTRHYHLPFNRVFFCAAHNGANNFNIFSQIRDYNVKQEFQWYANSSNTVRFGVNAIYHRIRPGEVTSPENSAVNGQTLQERYSFENAAYATNSWKISNKWNVTYGIRLTAFSILGKGDFYTLDNTGAVADTLHFKNGDMVKTYFNPEPRLALSYAFTPSASIKVSYVRNVQNLHLISSSTTSRPTDKWVASTNNIKTRNSRPGFPWLL